MRYVHTCDINPPAKREWTLEELLDEINSVAMELPIPSYLVIRKTLLRYGKDMEARKMTGKILGKIVRAEFGTYKDRPFLMGLQLEFSLNGGACGGVGTGSKYTVNVSDDCRWEHPGQREQTITSKVFDLYKILQDAKCNYVSELKGKPVEVTIEDNMLKDFRILTEVL